MRGDDRQQGAIWSYISPERRVPADLPLRGFQEMVNAVLKDMSRTFSRIYAKEGRPSIPPEHLLRALLLQVLYSVRSERMLMEQLDYNCSSGGLSASTWMIRFRARRPSARIGNG